jgi:hypothetical protein
LRPGVDQFIAMPISTYRKHYPESKEVFLAFTSRRDVAGELAREEVTEALRRIRRVPHSAAA